MVLATAQQQQKALSLANIILLSAIGCQGSMQVFSLYWDTDNLMSLYVFKAKNLLQFFLEHLHL